MRKVKMATILLLYKINYLIFTPQMSSDGLNLPTVHPPPLLPDALHGNKINRINSN